LPYYGNVNRCLPYLGKLGHTEALAYFKYQCKIFTVASCIQIRANSTTDFLQVPFLLPMPRPKKQQCHLARAFRLRKCEKRVEELSASVIKVVMQWPSQLSGRAGWSSR
jgi:hypothetical protein